MTHRAKRHEYSKGSYKQIHETIFPADVRKTDSVFAQLIFRDSEDEPKPVQVWKLSPLGIEIVLPKNLHLTKGQKIDLQLQIARQNTTFRGLIVDVIESVPAGTIAGIRLSGRKPTAFDNENRRKATRWQCSTQFYPVATCPNPVEFNDFIYFRVKDLSAAGLKAITSLQNKFLVPGMKLSLQVSFPMTGFCNVEGKISRADLTAEDGKDYLELGVEFAQLAHQDREIMGQYLIQFGDSTSLAEIREEGLLPKSLVAGLDYTFVKTEDEFLESLSLRHIANSKAGKISSDFSPNEMSDLYDARSRIINWNFQGKCVGTVRITFCEQDEKLELEEYLPLPANFPRRDEIVEVGRAATHPDYRKSDLFYNLVQRVVLLCLQSNRSFILMSTTEELLPLYRKVGLTDSTLTYTHPLYPTKTQHVLYIEAKKLLSAETVGFFEWNLIWKDLATHVVDIGICEAQEIETSKSKVYRYLAPITFVSKFFMKRPRKNGSSTLRWF